MTSPTNPDLAQAIQSYLMYCQKARRLSRHTCSAYKTDLTVFQALAGAESVNCETIVPGLEKIIANPDHKPATIGRRVVAIHGFLNWWDPSLVYEVFSRIKFRMKKPKRLPRTIPRSELNLILAAARDARPSLVGEEMHLILLLLASTGLRVSELCSLRPLDIDSAKGELKVFGKGSKERVVVIANSMVRAALAKYIGEKRQGVPRRPPCFPISAERRLRPNGSRCG